MRNRLDNPYYGERHDLEKRSIEDYGNMTWGKSKTNDKVTRSISRISEDLIEINLRKSINESLHISNYVDYMSHKILNELPENISQNKANRKVNDDGICFIEGSITQDFLKQRITIYYTFYNFKTKEEYNKLHSKYDRKVNTAYSSYDKRMSIIKISILGISGTIQKKSLLDSLMHELAHVYNQNMCLYSLPKDKHYLNKISHISDINIIPRCISRLFYYSYEFEQNGFVNGLYGELMNKDVFKTISFSELKDTFCYKQYKKALSSFKYIEKNKDNPEVIDFLKQYNIIDVDNFLKKIKKHLDNFLKKIGDTLIKAHNDYEEQHNVRESFSPLLDQSSRYLW